MHASTRAGRPYNTDATAAPTGGHPISIVVADDTSFVAHLGNAGRPHRRRQPAQTSRHDQQCGSQANEGLDSRAHTGNAERTVLAIAAGDMNEADVAAWLMDQGVGLYAEPHIVPAS